MSARGWLKRGIRAVVPPVLLRPVEQRFFRVRWTGDYASWAKARAASEGYEAPAILERAIAAVRQVRDGVAAYERDGRVFYEAAVHEPLLRCLQRAARGGTLDVLDVGGALGSAYWQHRSWLATLRPARWSVVELPAVVAAGRREFANDELQFFETIAEACAGGTPDVAVLASVLPYVEKPDEVLAAVAASGVRWVMIDRTGVIDGPRDRITVQHVPRALGGSSYPCRFFSRERLLASLGAYAIREEFDTTDGHASGFTFRGFVLERRVNE